MTTARHLLTAARHPWQSLEAHDNHETSTLRSVLPSHQVTFRAPNDVKIARLTTRTPRESEAKSEIIKVYATPPRKETDIRKWSPHGWLSGNEIVKRIRKKLRWSSELQQLEDSGHLQPHGSLENGCVSLVCRVQLIWTISWWRTTYSDGSCWSIVIRA